MRRRFIQTALIGILCANVATVLAVILYGLTVLHESLTVRNLGLFVYMALSSEVTLLPAGIGAGVLSWTLLRRLGAVGGTLAGTVLMTALGALVGYAFTLGAPHVVPRDAILDVAIGWGITALVALSVFAWRGARSAT
jgi:hypothetical protein